MEALYERAFPEKEPRALFWRHAEDLVAEWPQLTAKRPISEADLDRAEKTWLKKFIDLCVVEREHGKQA